MIRKAMTLFLFLSMAVVLQGQEKPDALKAFQDGRYKEAEEICLAELEVSSQNMDSYAVLCWSLQAQGKYEEALTYARKGMEVARYDTRMIYTAAEALYFLGRNRDSLKYFEEYVAFFPTGGKIRNVFYYMGEIYIRLGEFNNADISFSTALHYYDRSAAWWSRLGYAREMAKEYRWALEAYERALRLNPNLAEAKLGKDRVSKQINS